MWHDATIKLILQIVRNALIVRYIIWKKRKTRRANMFNQSSSSFSMSTPSRQMQSGRSDQNHNCPHVCEQCCKKMNAYITNLELHHIWENHSELLLKYHYCAWQCTPLWNLIKIHAREENYWYHESSNINDIYYLFLYRQLWIQSHFQATFVNHCISAHNLEQQRPSRTYSNQNSTETLYALKARSMISYGCA